MLAPAPEAYDDAYTPLPLNLPGQCGGAWQCEWIPGAPVTAARGASRSTALEDVRADYRSTTHSGDEG